MDISNNLIIQWGYYACPGTIIFPISFSNTSYNFVGQMWSSTLTTHATIYANTRKISSIKVDKYESGAPTHLLSIAIGY